VAGADDDEVDPLRLEPLLQRADRDVRAVGVAVVALLQLEAVAVRAVRLENERGDTPLRIQQVVRVDLLEDVLPTRALEAGEAEGLIEAAVAGHGEVGAEDDAAAASDLAHARGLDVAPGLIEQVAPRRVRRGV